MPLKKIGQAIKKTVRKIVPKEVSGIMRVAAPFVAAKYGLPEGLALSLAGQLRSGRGRINPLETVLAVAPSEQFRGFTKSSIPGGEALDKFLYGSEMTLGESRIVPGEGFTDVAVFPETQGILGVGGKFGLKEVVGSKLLSPGGTLSKPSLAALAAAGLSLATATKQLEEEAVEEGASDSDIEALKAEAADFWSTLSSEDFKVTPTLAQGGRVGFAEGTDTTIANIPQHRDVAAYLRLKDLLDKDYYFMDSKDLDNLNTMQKERFMYDYDPKKSGILEQIKEIFVKKDKDDRQASADPMTILNQMAIDMFNKPLDQLNDREKEMILSFMKPKAKKGGLMRQNLALGTRPTVQESGLGGLPIEADMRYSGGFMPYGAREKADDVPARLSKNEFVFTADAVRAAGGGSVQKGAQKMYNTMKQLEAMGKA